MKKLIIFIDSGDTLVDESTEVREVPDYRLESVPELITLAQELEEELLLHRK